MYRKAGRMGYDLEVVVTCCATLVVSEGVGLFRISPAIRICILLNM